MTTRAKVSHVQRIRPARVGSCRSPGFINGRTVRLPTVCIRTGAPSTAASSFISGLIREPLQGQPAVCPIASSPEDPILENMPIYVTRSKTVVENILYALTLDEKKMLEIGGKGVGRLRTINLPGIKINTRDILNALCVEMEVLHHHTANPDALRSENRPAAKKRLRRSRTKRIPRSSPSARPGPATTIAQFRRLWALRRIAARQVSRMQWETSFRISRHETVLIPHIRLYKCVWSPMALLCSNHGALPGLGLPVDPLVAIGTMMPPSSCSA